MEFPKVTLEVSLTRRHFCGLISDVAKGLSLFEAFQALGKHLGGLWDQDLPSRSETRLVQLPTHHHWESARLFSHAAPLPMSTITPQERPSLLIIYPACRGACPAESHFSKKDGSPFSVPVVMGSW